MSLVIGPFAAGGRLIATDWEQHAARHLRASYAPATRQLRLATCLTPPSDRRLPAGRQRERKPTGHALAVRRGVPAVRETPRRS